MVEEGDRMIKFTKMHGLGNDYVYMDAINQEIDDPSKMSQYVSDRHFGVGSDGLILICNSDVADFKMRMFNSDGSEAEMCGNGIRCVGKFVYDKGLTNKEIITVETLAGIKELLLNIEDGVVSTVRVDMGQPILEASKIPVVSDEDVVRNLHLKAIDREFIFTCVSMGNPHAITVVEDNKNFDVYKYGSILEVDKAFPNKSNIEFVTIEDRNNVSMRVWERGAGETLACGTGASAVVVACCLNQLTERNVRVHLLGGDLDIEWNKNDNHVYMTGSATMVFEGELYPKKLVRKK